MNWYNDLQLPNESGVLATRSYVDDQVSGVNRTVASGLLTVGPDAGSTMIIPIPSGINHCALYKLNFLVVDTKSLSPTANYYVKLGRKAGAARPGQAAQTEASVQCYISPRYENYICVKRLSGDYSVELWQSERDDYVDDNYPRFLTPESITPSAKLCKSIDTCCYNCIDMGRSVIGGEECVRRAMDADDCNRQYFS